jgi:hypothetical protein
MWAKASIFRIGPFWPPHRTRAFVVDDGRVLTLDEPAVIDAALALGDKLGEARTDSGKETPPDWETGRRRYFALNGIRALATWGAFGSSLQRWSWTSDSAAGTKHAASTERTPGPRQDPRSPLPRS